MNITKIGKMLKPKKFRIILAKISTEKGSKRSS